MNLHEYQGKELLKKYGVAVQEGIVIDKKEDAAAAAKKLSEQTGTKVWVVKAQIHAGGRGKGGGVKVATVHGEGAGESEDILGMTLVTPQTGPAGKKVNKVLIAQDMYMMAMKRAQRILYDHFARSRQRRKRDYVQHRRRNGN